MPSKAEKENSAKISVKEQQEIVRWLTERYDGLRASTANRSAIVVSIDTLLMASITFLLDKTLSGNIQYTDTEKTIIVTSIGISFLLLLLSLVYAVNGIANIWKSTKKMFGDGMEDKAGLFFHSFHTARALKNFVQFSDEFKKSTPEKFLEYSLINLWLMENLFNKYRRSLERAMKLLLFSFAPFLLAVLVLIAKLLVY